uniref:sigma 54-interacting transcriptional regulator n=1 Tax=Neisseria dentiae TaxID=194197 RepID=UPI0035A16149
FSGADRKGKTGLIQAPDGGTLFLDEIGDMPLYLQSRLLRVLSEREVMPVGSIHAVKVDIRIIAATHHDLQANIAAGKFREDLYYRLNGLNVVLPGLRERDDFDYALQTVLRHVARNNGLAPKPVSAEAMNIMRRHRWPGNIRQLANALEVALHSAKGAQIQPEDLPDYLYAHRPSENPSAPTGNTQNSKAILQDPASLQNALQAAAGCVSRLARDLGVSRMTVYRYLKKYGAAE